MNKPTDKQYEIITAIAKEIKFWGRSNDIDSPTLDSDIKEALRVIDINVDEKKLIYSKTRDLLQSIRKIDEKKTRN